MDMCLQMRVEGSAVGVGRRGSTAVVRVGCERDRCSSHREAEWPQFDQGRSLEEGYTHGGPTAERRALEGGTWGEGVWSGCQWRHRG